MRLLTNHGRLLLGISADDARERPDRDTLDIANELRQGLLAPQNTGSPAPVERRARALAPQSATHAWEQAVWLVAPTEPEQSGELRHLRAGAGDIA
jgi:hypothetical protein